MTSHDVRPLWQLLLETAVPPENVSLTCSDCFSILEYLADINQGTSDKPKLIQKARKHLAACPDCQTFYQQRLDELEEMLKDGQQKQ
jgi:hypothetical protein